MDATIPAPHDTAERLTDLVLATIEDLVERHLPGWRIPGGFAGHPVEPDVAADLVFTLGHVGDLGITEVAGTPLEEAISTVLRAVDGRRTHTFFSYRVAETLARFGHFDDNPLMDGWSDAERAEIETAVDSTDWLELLDLGLPRNYAAVLARCELARHDLGLEVDDAVLAGLVERTRAMLSADPLRFLDDSTHGVGRHDIYAADVWLFTEPLAPLLGELWTEGVEAATALVEAVAAPDGTAVPWGRSSGLLGIALSAEMAALVLSAHPRPAGWTDAPGWWAGLAATAADSVTDPDDAWFRDGLVSAHQNRSPYGYRGPFRRLQMTLDVLGKLAWAAIGLRSAAAADAAADAGPRAAGARDRLVTLSSTTPAAVWTYDHGPLGFVLPFVGATCSDYLAAPRRPGMFEVPVDSPIACWVPQVAARHRVWAPAGLPAEVAHTTASVTARWDGLEVTGELDPGADAEHLGGAARLTYRASGRSLELEVDLQLDDAPDGVWLAVPEAGNRPLRVEVTGGDGAAHLDTIDTAGIAEWRSYYGELPFVHQVDLDPGRTMQVTLAVTPTIRVASTNHDHHYDRCLYGPLEADGRAVSWPSPLGPMGDASVRLANVDVFHLHWPEWLAFDDLGEHERIVAALAAARVPVLWTAHNLTPHDKRPEVYDPIYRLWAGAADTVVHHSQWGEEAFRRRYGFPATTRHVVIPHGHFGELYPTAATSRTAAEAALGLPPAPLRIGLLGAPRHERRVVDFLAAAAASTNPDIQVCCWSLERGGTAPDDPRIAVAEEYRNVPAEEYGLRLAALDAIALPFDPDGEMLGTGVAADALGCGLAALTSSWGYLAEVLGDAAIPMGDDAASMASALDALDPVAVGAARGVARARRDAVSWDRVAAATMAELERLLR